MLSVVVRGGYNRRCINPTKGKPFAGFAGWDYLAQSVEDVDEDTKALFGTLFETGTRGSECLMLEPKMFVKHPDYVMVVNAPVLKHRVKLRDANGMLQFRKDKDGKFLRGKDGLGLPIWERKDTWRTFPIPLSDTLAAPMMDWVESHKGDKYLFGGLDKPIYYRWLYSRIASIGKPKDASFGEWFPHRLRAERACELIMEKGFDIFSLMGWFGWSRSETPLFYAKIAPMDLVRLVLKGEI